LFWLQLTRRIKIWQINVMKKKTWPLNTQHSIYFDQRKWTNYNLRKHDYIPMYLFITLKSTRLYYVQQFNVILLFYHSVDCKLYRYLCNLEPYIVITYIKVCFIFLERLFYVYLCGVLDITESINYNDYNDYSML